MKTVIVVDDEPITRLDICQILEDLGFNVLDQAGDGFDAVELCRIHCPDVVLMDVRMPIFDGISATRTIVEEDIAGCVVLLTAFSDKDLIEDAVSVGVTGYLTKPLDQRLVLPTIEVAYAQSQKLKQSNKEKLEAEEKLQETKTIERAKSIIAKEKNVSALDAYKELRKTAMTKRCTLISLAKAIVEQYEKGDKSKRNKHKLMNIWNTDEHNTSEKIRKYAKENNISFDIAVEKLLEIEKNKLL